MIGEGVGERGWVRRGGVGLIGWWGAGGGVAARWVGDGSSDVGRALVMANSVEARGAIERGWGWGGGGGVWVAIAERVAMVCRRGVGATGMVRGCDGG